MNNLSRTIEIGLYQLDGRKMHAKIKARLQKKWNYLCKKLPEELKGILYLMMEESSKIDENTRRFLANYHAHVLSHK